MILKEKSYGVYDDAILPEEQEKLWKVVNGVLEQFLEKEDFEELDVSFKIDLLRTVVKKIRIKNENAVSQRDKWDYAEVRRLIGHPAKLRRLIYDVALAEQEADEARERAEAGSSATKGESGTVLLKLLPMLFILLAPIMTSANDGVKASSVNWGVMVPLIALMGGIFAYTLKVLRGNGDLGWSRKKSLSAGEIKLELAKETSKGREKVTPPSTTNSQDGKGMIISMAILVAILVSFGIVFSNQVRVMVFIEHWVLFSRIFFLPILIVTGTILYYIVWPAVRQIKSLHVKLQNERIHNAIQAQQEAMKSGYSDKELQEKVVPSLIKALGDENEALRAGAEANLVKIGEPAVLKLIEALGSENLWIRDCSVDALVEIGKPAVPALIEGLKYDDEKIRAMAARVLGRMKEVSAVSALIEALGDEDSFVRQTVSYSLFEIGESAKLGDDQKALRKLIDEALKNQMAAKAAEGKESWDPWSEKIKSHAFRARSGFWMGICFDVVALVSLFLIFHIGMKVEPLNLLIVIGVDIIFAIYPLMSALRIIFLDMSVEKSMKQAGLTEKSAKNTDIARSDGYRHEAFQYLSTKNQRLINIHESFESHFYGMLAMLPVVSLFFGRKFGVFRKKVLLQESKATFYAKAQSDIPQDIIEAGISDFSNVREMVLEKIRKVLYVDELERLLDIARIIDANDRSIGSVTRTILERQSILLNMENVTDVDRLTEFLKISARDTRERIIDRLFDIGGYKALEVAREHAFKDARMNESFKNPAGTYDSLTYPASIYDKIKEHISSRKDADFLARMCKRFTNIKEVKEETKPSGYYSEAWPDSTWSYLKYRPVWREAKYSIEHVPDFADLKTLVNDHERLTRLIEEERARVKIESTEEPKMHDFQPISGLRTGMFAGILSHVSMGFFAFQHFMQRDVKGLGIAAIVLGVYFGWATARYIAVAVKTYSALRGQGLSRQYAWQEAIASSDGYRHRAFQILSIKNQKLINIHESFRSHALGMFAMFPGVAFLFRKRASIQEEKTKPQKRISLHAKGKVRSLFSRVFAFFLTIFSPVRRNIWLAGSKNVYLRRWGVGALGKLSDKRAVAALIRALKDEDDLVRTKAVFSLLSIGKLAFEALATEIETEVEYKGSNAAVFCSILGKRHVWSQEQALVTMTEIDKSAVPILMKLLRDPNASSLVRSSAAHLLGKIGDERAVPVLIEALGDEGPWVRHNAGNALKNIGKPAIPLLKKELENKDSAISKNVSEILRAMGELASNHTNCALILNCGSSSVKYKLYDMDDETVVEGTEGIIEEIGKEGSDAATHEEAIDKILKNLPVEKGAIKVIGHRVVHGGEDFKESVMITPEVKAAIKKNIQLAPLHNPANLAGIEACEEAFPNTVQVAVFDTAAHQTMEPEAYLYAIPYELYEKHGIRRYGFHGTSHRYVSDRAAKMLEKPQKELKIITCHLGNGASVAAKDGGKFVETSMGATPLEGLVMGTRSGDIDPALLEIIAKEEGMTVGEVVKLLNKASGLKGLYGISSDMREIKEAAEKGDPRAIIARKVFIHRLIKYIGGYTAVMNGVDAIVFTGGIGENDKELQKAVCERLSFLGLELEENPTASKSKEKLLTAKKSKVAAMVIPTDEEGVIMRDAKAIYHKVQNGSVVDKPSMEVPKVSKEPKVDEVAVEKNKIGKTQDDMTKLFEVIEECINNRRDMIIRDGNKLIEGVNSYSGENVKEKINSINSDMLTAEIRDRLEKAISIAKNLNTSNSRIIELTSQIKKELDQLEADSVVGSTITLAREIGRKKISANEKRKLVIALEMEWIPGYRAETVGGGKSSEREAMSVLMQELTSLGKTMGDHDLRNVEVVFRKKGESLNEWSDRIVEKAGNQKDLSNVVVLGSYSATDNFESQKMFGLRNPAKRAFLAAVHPDALQKLNEFYREHKDMDELLIIEITKMLSIALELASGKIVQSLSIIDKDSYDPIMRKVMFLPRMDAMKYTELREHYKAKLKALIAA